VPLLSAEISGRDGDEPTAKHEASMSCVSRRFVGEALFSTLNKVASLTKTIPEQCDPHRSIFTMTADEANLTTPALFLGVRYWRGSIGEDGISHRVSTYCVKGAGGHIVGDPTFRCEVVPVV
jgi:hypothetical protein